MRVCNIQSYVHLTHPFGIAANNNGAIRVVSPKELEVSLMSLSSQAAEPKKLTFDGVYTGSIESMIDDSNIPRMLGQLTNGYNVGLVSISAG